MALTPVRGSRAETLGTVYIAMASLLFGGTVILGKLLTNRDVPVTSMLAIRFSTAALLLAIVLGLTRRPLRPAPGEGRRLLALGAIGYALESGLFFLALSHGSTAAVTLIFFTYPVLVAVLSAVLGMGMPGWLLGGSLLAALTGTALVVLSSGGVEVSGLGILFGLGSALTFALYLIGAEASLKRTSSMVASMWVSGAAATALAAYSLVSGTGTLPEGIHGWLPVLGMGAFTAGAFSFLFLGLQRLGAIRTSIVAAMEPVAASLLAAAFLAEPLRPGTVGGGLLILAAAVAASVARRGLPQPDLEAP